MEIQKKHYAYTSEEMFVMRVSVKECMRGVIEVPGEREQETYSL